MLNKTVLAVVISAALGLTACNSDDEKIVLTDSGLTSVVAEGKTLSNTPDVF